MHQNIRGIYNSFSLTPASHQEAISAIINKQMFPSSCNSKKMDRLAMDYYNMRLSLHYVNEEINSLDMKGKDIDLFKCIILKDTLIKKRKILNRIRKKNTLKNYQSAVMDYRANQDKINRIDKYIKKLMNEEGPDSLKNYFEKLNTAKILKGLCSVTALDSDDVRKPQKLGSLVLTHTGIEYRIFDLPILFSINLNLFDSLSGLMDILKDPTNKLFSLEKFILCDMVYNNGKIEYHFNNSDLGRKELSLTKEMLDKVADSLDKSIKMFSHYYFEYARIRQSYNKELVDSASEYLSDFRLPDNSEMAKKSFIPIDELLRKH